MKSFKIICLLIFKLFGCYGGWKVSEDDCQKMENRSYNILGIGASCIDLLVQVDENFLQFVPGEKGGSQIVEVEVLQQILKMSEKTPQIATGGSCANSIKGLAHLGEKCALLTCVGSDQLGAYFSETMINLGVTPLFSASRHPSAQVLCLITPEGQRTMRSCLGSSQDMSERYLNPNYFKGVKLIHLDAYCLRNGSLLKEAFELAKKAHAKISLDLSSFEVVRKYKDFLIELLNEYVDIVFANEDEIFALTGLGPFEGCLELNKCCPITVVLTGEKGCIVGYGGEAVAYPTFPAEVIDSTGAGDLFASGFLYGVLNQYPISQCARLGNRLGSAIVEVQGADLPEETWQKIRLEI